MTTDLSRYDLGVQYGESVVVFCRRCRDPYYAVGDFPLPLGSVTDVRDALDIAEQHGSRRHAAEPGSMSASNGEAKYSDLNPRHLWSEQDEERWRFYPDEAPKENADD